MEHFFTEDNISIFLIQLIALLGFSKILGSVCRKIGLSYVVGEILTGIIMGPTILKRILPGVYHFIFRADQIQFFMLETTSLFGSLFLLLIIGFNLHMGSIKKQLGTTLKAGIAGSMIPFILSLAVYTFIPEKYMGGNATKLAFVIFLAASSAVNSIPVIAKVLFDFGLIKSDLGLITLVSYTANDILLWVMFTISFSLVNLGSNSIMNFVITIGGLMLFCSAAFIFGSRLLTLFFKKVLNNNKPNTSTILVLIAIIGMICGVITMKLGIGAIFGFFIAGIIVGNTHEINEYWKDVLSQVMNAIFVPLFFITIGLSLDFFAHFDLTLIIIIILTSIIGKGIGGYIGGLWSGLPRADHFTFSIANIPGGTIEIILGTVALKTGLIKEPVLIAIVISALASSILVSPLMSLSIKLRKGISINSFLRKKAIVLNSTIDNINGVISALAEKVEKLNPHLNAEKIFRDVTGRESLMSTSIGKGVAVPHARLEEIFSPVIAYMNLNEGIGWDARDGLPVKHVFMILLPKNEHGEQVQILGAIARMAVNGLVLLMLDEIKIADEAFNILDKAFKDFSSKSIKKKNGKVKKAASLISNLFI